MDEDGGGEDEGEERFDDLEGDGVGRGFGVALGDGVHDEVD